MKLQKLTEPRQAASKRRYEDACGTAHALDLLGERWALLVVRELMLGPKRFSDLRADLPALSANVLTQRLEGLEASGLLVRRKLPPPSNAQVYELTPWGYEVEPIIITLGRWAVKSPAHNPTLPISPTSLMLSFRAMIDPERARQMSGRFGFRLGSESFVAEVADGNIEIRRAPAEDVDAVFIASAPALGGAIYDGGGLDPFIESGDLRIEGDRAAAERFVRLFVMPPKVSQ